MKASQLMQGDIVLYEYKGERFTAVVREIYKESVLVEEIALVYEPIEIPMQDIYPIPLTPEILEKNGFRLIGERFVFGEIDDALVELKVSINNSYRAKISVADLMTSHNGWIMYVHQLQHALRICGIEKEIVL